MKVIQTKKVYYLDHEGNTTHTTKEYYLLNYRILTFKSKAK